MKKFNLVIIPDNGGKVKQACISKKVAWLGLLFFCCLLICSMLFSYNLITLVSTKIELRASENEVSLLKAQVKEITEKSDSLKVKFQELLESEKMMRTIAGLPEIDQEIRQFGIGGPELMVREHSEIRSVDLALNVRYNLDSLYHLVNLEALIMNEICSTYKDQKRVLDLTPTISPMDGYLTSKFGPRQNPFTGLQQMHEGIDISAPVGTPVKATADGRVVFSGWKKGFGRVVKINHVYYTTVYAHLHKILVQPGEKVKRHQVIATCGKTGYTTGPHLHYEVLVSNKHVDPLDYIYPRYIY
ncbi:peptidoglycan DD-metalloendopeptidase family protein [bacterium]|nr:peptidoglycan DD-metalloendopeptidase family protein [bacterium]